MSDTKPAPATGIDIFDLDPVAASEQGADLELVHPASQRGLGIFMQIIGNESAEVRAYAKGKVTEQTRKNFSRKGNRKPDPEQLAQETVDRIFDRSASVDLAMVALKGWWRYANPEAPVLEGQTEVEAKGRIDSITFGGKELQFSPENARRVLTERPWIATQIDAGTQDLDHFFPN